MKLSNLLTLMGDNDTIVVCEDVTLRLPTEELFKGTVLECYHHPRLLKRKVMFLFALNYDIIIYVK